MLSVVLSARAEGQQELSECEALLASQPAEKTTAVCFYDTARSQGTSGTATRLLLELGSSRRDLPWFTYYAANLHYSSDAALALEMYLRAVQAFRDVGSVEGEVYSRINRSQLLRKLGRDNEARGEIETVFRLTEASEDPALKTWGQITLVRDLLRTGEDLGRAYSLLKGMEALPESEQSDSLRRDRLLLLGNVCLKVGRVAEGLDAFLQLADMAAREDDKFLEATLRYTLAWAAFERFNESPGPENRADVVEMLARTLEVAAVAGHHTVEAKAARLLASISPGERGEALLGRCLEAAQSPGLRSYCLSGLAPRQAFDDPELAERTSRQALTLAQESDEVWWKVFALQSVMRVRWAADPPEEALADSWAALDAIEEIRSRQTEGSAAQAGLFSVWSDDYAWLAGRLLSEAGDRLERSVALAEAFRVNERMRARALTDWLRRADPDRTADWRPPTPSSFAALDHLRAVMGPDEALLSFQVAPWEDLAGDFGGGSWLLAITRDRVTVHRLPGRVDIRRAVRLFDGLVARRDGAEAGPAAHLYHQLLEPALAELPPDVHKLILIPDDALHRLPFAALRPAPDAPPLGLRYELVRAPSATLWLHWREGGPVPPPKRPLLVLADPELPAHGPAEAPTGSDGLDGIRVAQARGGKEAEESLGPLPYAREEGREAVRALGGGLLLVGPEASEAALGRLDLGSFGLLHLAAHAVTDEDRPERSAVLLATGPADGADQGRAGPRRADRSPGAERADGEDGVDRDGRLESSEIARLHLDGRTVVLASCRSAGGTVLRGEGVMSLARAFFQAGAHGVVASLWPLRDDESAVLFRRFYRRLAEGATVGEALHGARREAIEAGEPAAAWAGLVVLGDGDLVPVAVPRSSIPGPAAIAVLVILTLLAGAWLYRQSRT